MQRLAVSIVCLLGLCCAAVGGWWLFREKADLQSAQRALDLGDAERAEKLALEVASQAVRQVASGQGGPSRAWLIAGDAAAAQQRWDAALAYYQRYGQHPAQH